MICEQPIILDVLSCELLKEYSLDFYSEGNGVEIITKQPEISHRKVGLKKSVWENHTMKRMHLSALLRKTEDKCQVKFLKICRIVNQLFTFIMSMMM